MFTEFRKIAKAWKRFKTPTKSDDTPEFEREFRYLVFKIKDISKYLTIEEKEKFLVITSKISKGRAEDGKMPIDCVVVESDWPEYEPTWAAIEARVNDDKGKLTGEYE